MREWIETARAIQARLLSVSEFVSAEIAHLAKLRQPKHGLMHDLLTGRVRVNVPTAAVAVPA